MTFVGVILGCGARGSTPTDICEPGITRECIGPGACRGGQQCGDEGRWGICECGPITGTSTGTGGSNFQTSQYSSGGQPSGGFATGGRANSGGLSSSSTAASSAGTAGFAKGGTNSTGTNATKAGGTNAGGMSTGGKSNGGTTAQAGSGGWSTTGGVSYTGGSYTGGSHTGGSHAGGSYTGPTGGSPTGGSPTGGGPTGGSPTGGYTGWTTTTVPNQPPVINKVTLSPLAPRTNDTLSVAIDATDPDGNWISYTYAWTRNGDAVGYNYSQLDGWSYFSKGDSIRVTVTPSDGKVSGTPVTSDAVVVVNSPPEINYYPYITPSDFAGDDEDLTCQPPYSISDPDGDPVTTQYRWYRNGTLTTQTGTAVSATTTAIGDYWTCQISATDGTSVVDSSTSTQTLVISKVSGIYRSDMTWEAAKSPYYLADRVQIASGITLKVEPGVTVYGQGYTIESWGNISMLGTKEKPILVQSLWIVDNSTAASPGNIELAFVEYDSGSLLGSTTNASTHVSDCVFNALQQPIYIFSPLTSTHLFERNVFRYGYGIQSSAPLKLVNNVFQDYYYYPEVVVQDSLVANLNSFLVNNNPLVTLGAKSADVTNNYWGGLLDTDIPNYIVDNNDDLNIAGTATYLPTLASAHPDTPPPDRTYNP